MARLRRERALRPVLVLALIASGVGLGRPALADSGNGDGAVTPHPLPATASEAYSPIGEGFESPLDPRDDLKGPKPYIDEREERLKAQREQRQTASFFRDTEIKANSRTYWFGEDSFGNGTPEALTTGGYLSYQSGFAAEFLQLRGVLYTTQPLYCGRRCGRHAQSDGGWRSNHHARANQRADEVCRSGADRGPAARAYALYQSL
jgi:hypothetical protein